MARVRAYWYREDQLGGKGAGSIESARSLIAQRTGLFITLEDSEGRILWWPIEFMPDQTAQRVTAWGGEFAVARDRAGNVVGYIVR